MSSKTASEVGEGSGPGRARRRTAVLCPRDPSPASGELQAWDGPSGESRNEDGVSGPPSFNQ